MIGLLADELPAWITPDALHVLRLADIWSKGSPPVAGGTLDQTASMVEAAELIWADQETWRAHYKAQAMEELDG